ncbi:MAG: peptidylprolyl isomerase [Acidobacteriaceae bacterium]|nr:peptidylprolyl isomerase [Acidobacteriaceae bacterium]MBV9766677.1 peptidylprolyl isomerase [Acidobacteriaceae bacterium]
MFVNGEYVDDELIRIEAVSLRERLRAQNPSADDLELAIEAQNWARENLIERTLLRTAAQHDSAPISPEQIESALREYYERDARHAKCMLPPDHEALRASIELDLRIESLTNRIAAQAVRPKPREIKQYYDTNKQSFYVPEVVHAAHIVKNVDEIVSDSEAFAAITSIQTLLSSGAEFEEIADRFSDCPGRGGDLGTFPRGEMVEEFDEVVFGLTPGETSDIFRTRFGFHIVKLFDRRPARLRSLDEVRSDVEKFLCEERKAALIRSYIARLRSRAEIRKYNPLNPRPAT